MPVNYDHRIRITPPSNKKYYVEINQYARKTDRSGNDVFTDAGSLISETYTQFETWLPQKQIPFDQDNFISTSWSLYDMDHKTKYDIISVEEKPRGKSTFPTNKIFINAKRTG